MNTLAHIKGKMKSNAQWNHWPEQLLFHFHGNQSRSIIMISVECRCVRFVVHVCDAVTCVYFVSPSQHTQHTQYTHCLSLNVALVDVDAIQTETELHPIFQHRHWHTAAFSIRYAFCIYFIRFKNWKFINFRITLRWKWHSLRLMCVYGELVLLFSWLHSQVMKGWDAEKSNFRLQTAK